MLAQKIDRISKKMSQEYSFTPLVTLRITRLIRPQPAVPQMLESALVPLSASSSADESTLLSNEVAECGWALDNMFVFPVKFGYLSSSH